MGNPCGVCNIVIQEGMKIFCIVEMVLSSIFALSMFGFLLSLIFIHDDESGLLQTVVISAAVSIFMTECVLTFLMFIRGISLQDIRICKLWMFMAALELLLGSSLFAIVNVAAAFMIFIVRSYLVYGIWVVYEYVKWVKRGEEIPAEGNITVVSHGGHLSHVISIHNPRRSLTRHGSSNLLKSPGPSPSPRASFNPLGAQQHSALLSPPSTHERKGSRSSRHSRSSFNSRPHLV